MRFLAWVFAVGALAPAGAPRKTELRLTELVAAVRSADYRGDREALARLAAALGAFDAASLEEYRSYWQGFARWRRALNGFNETPTPEDLGQDLEKAVVHFRASLESRPDWVEPKLGMVGCWGSLIFLAGADNEKRAAILKEAVPAMRALEEQGRDNPRALWIIGGMRFSAPPPYGDPVKALATLHRGLEAARREAAAGASAPGWIPAWGGPENLMNLSYMYSHGAAPDRALALAYAEGALAAVPEWHYVRDVLLPQIEALPLAAAAR